MSKITAKDISMRVIKVNMEDYICISDMVKAKAGRA
jgi:hypothetical protein